MFMNPNVSLDDVRTVYSGALGAALMGIEKQPLPYTNGMTHSDVPDGIDP